MSPCPHVRQPCPRQQWQVRRLALGECYSGHVTRGPLRPKLCFCGVFLFPLRKNRCDTVKKLVKAIWLADWEKMLEPSCWSQHSTPSRPALGRRSVPSCVLSWGQSCRPSVAFWDPQGGARSVPKCGLRFHSEKHRAGARSFKINLRGLDNKLKVKQPHIVSSSEKNNAKQNTFL